MPLDLSGYAIKERTFNELPKIGESMMQNRLLQQKQELDAAKSAKESQEKEQARVATGMSYLDDLYDNKKYATGNFADDEYMNGKLNSSISKFQDLLLKNKGVDVNQLKVLARQDANNIWDEKTKLSAVNQIAETAKKDMANKPGLDSDAAYNQIRNYYLKDGQGNVKTNFSDVKVDANDIPKILLGSGNVYNAGSFDDYVAKSGTTTRSYVHSTQVGKNKVDNEYRTNAPTNWVSETQDGQIAFVPKYEIATDNGAPLMHTIIKDGKEKQKEIRMVDEDIFNDFNKSQKAYLDQETAKFVAQSPTPPNPTQIHQFQKALAYHELETSSKLKIKAEKVEKTKTGGTGGGEKMTEGEKLLEQRKSDLYPSLDAEPRDSKNRMDITKYLTSVKAVGNIPILGQNNLSVLLDPSKREVTIVKEGQESTMPFSKFISTIQTANPKDDVTFVSLFGKYKPSKNAPAASAASPTPQSSIVPKVKKRLWH
jgi:hypothetical protein